MRTVHYGIIIIIIIITDIHTNIIRVLCNIVTMECSSEVVFACAYKRGVAGPNVIQNGGQIQTTTNFLHYKPAYNGHNALAKRVYTERSG